MFVRPSTFHADVQEYYTVSEQELGNASVDVEEVKESSRSSSIPEANVSTDALETSRGLM